MALRLSPRWIREYLQADLTTAALLEQLNATGFESELVDDLVIDPSIVIGKVVAVEKHPNADKLNVCQVHTGEKTLTIVCGCPSVTDAEYVIVAPIGAKLPHLTLKAVEIRGVASEGMLCSLQEIGLLEASNGIFHFSESVDVGMPLVEHLKHDSQLIEIDITPNRGDCLSVYGIARDLAATLNVGLESYPDHHGLSDSLERTDKLFDVNSDAVYTYNAMILSIDAQSKTPLMMVNRLRQAGMGCNHVVVDILNYIMLELGQPMHGFDQTSLNLPLIVDTKEKQSCLLLDDSVYETRGHDILVRDQSATHALAGVMGGFDSRMRPESTEVQLESAVFAPHAIAKTLRKSKLGSEASYRYERGVSSDLSEMAMFYAADLLMKHTGAVLKAYQLYNNVPEHKRIKPDTARINQCLGTSLTNEQVEHYLTRLGFENDGGDMIVPPYRYDVSILVDLIEEVARLYGYDQIDLEPMTGSLMPRQREADGQDACKTALMLMGYNEVVQFSFVSKASTVSISEDCKVIELENPIHSEYGCMRTNMIQSLLMAAQYNQQRQINSLKIFETGKVFRGTKDGIIEPSYVAGLCMGTYSSGFLNADESCDYYHIQSDMLTMLKHLGLSGAVLKRCGRSDMHPAQAADVYMNDAYIGYVGKLHPALCEAYGLEDVCVFNLCMDALPQKPELEVGMPSKYPCISRDITYDHKKDQPIAEVLDAIVSADIEHLKHAALQTIYELDGKLNVTLSIVFQSDEKTLADKQIDKAMDRIRNILK